MPKSSNLNRWDGWYAGLEDPQPYGDTKSYEIAARWLNEVDGEIADWGCGKGWMSTLVEPGRYFGIDGSETPFASLQHDLATVQHSSPGLFMRHVLEHNYNWRDILINALASFTQRMVLVTFIPFSEQQRVLTVNDHIGVPDISLPEQELMDLLMCAAEPIRIEEIESKTQYKGETIFYIGS